MSSADVATSDLLRLSIDFFQPDTEPSQHIPKLFNVPELFEHVLLLLDLTDLLRIQRVCKTWQHFITSSSAIQKALFFAPDYSCEQRCNPLLQKFFPSFYDVGELLRTVFVDRLPWLKWGDGLHTVSYKDLPGWHARDRTTWEDVWIRESFLHQDASWNRMFTHQSPITLLEIRSQEHCDPSPCISHTCRENPAVAEHVVPEHLPGGLTAGRLFGLMVHYYSKEWRAWSVETFTEHSLITHYPQDGRLCTHGEFGRTALGRPDDCLAAEGLYMLLFFRRKIYHESHSFRLRKAQRKRRDNLLMWMEDWESPTREELIRMDLY